MVSPLSSITGDFLKTCTIQAYTETQDGSGELSQIWSDLPNHVGLKCVADRGSGVVKGEQVRDNTTLTYNLLEVTLFDSYPAITTLHQAVIDGVTYNIVDVYRDSLEYSTVLQVMSVC